ncbi:hypothetical protein PFFCH_05768, partial [Plasmodium falciparum FCH/4]
TVIDPCKHKSEERFSEVSGAECDDSKIKGSNGGSCAPFRRLHVCDRNLEQIKTENITTHNLLVDVCMAAQFEGASISGRYPKYQTTYGDTGYTMCTMLARSFADIGDIIRGKDLYEGYDEKEKKRRQQLENKLKKIFEKIHEDVMKTSGRRNRQTLKARYDGDTTNYYQLREDWWYANRIMVWIAMTCGAGESDKYFRKACSGGTTPTNKKCRCTTHDVPTYFDYVPQYLRWFEEWAEDFCRKKKHKLKDVMRKCRKPNGEDKYCSRNGFDCEQTIRVDNKLVKGECHKCSIACSNFVPWIDNQKQEFEKQKGKYTKEMQKYANGTTTKETSNGPINNLYVDDFYKKLKDVGYGGVEEFLKKLNDETTCKGHPEGGTEKASNVDFTNDKIEKTFDHKEYCKTCPWCGTEKKQDGQLTDKQDLQCLYKGITQFDDSNTTDINLLTPDRTKSNILDKYSKLCEKGDKDIQMEEWKCYYEEKKEYDDSDKDYCVLQDKKKNTQDRRIMPYETFFNVWIHEMLEDSIKWRTEYKNCINKEEATKCHDGCKTPCKCFAKWVEQKKKEWDKIEKHFDQQKNLEGMWRNMTLKIYLEELFMDKIKEAYGQEKCDELMQELDKIAMSQQEGDTVHSQDAIKILLKHEEDEAKKCLDTHNEKKCEEQATRARARSADPLTPGRPQPPPVIRRNVFEDEDHELSEDVPEAEEKTVEDTEETDPSVDVCSIVNTLFTNGEPKDIFKDACSLKYGSKSHVGWKCVPTTSGGDNSTTREGSESEANRQRREASGVVTTTGSGTNQGATCIPPRRRKLYVGKLEQWAKNSGNTVVSGQAQTPHGQTPSQSEKLRTAFIQSAAVETFFLWDRYKKIKEKEDIEKRQGEIGLFVDTSEVGKEHQEKLEEGEIPEEFKRQMFYTLGDYRDILFSCSNDNLKNIVLEASGTQEEKENMQKIQAKIKQTLESDNNQATSVTYSASHSGKPSSSGDNPHKALWDRIAQPIWNGMICALTYKESENGDKTIEQVNTANDGKNLFETLKEKYDYEKVKLDDTSDTQTKTNNDQTPTLKNFVERPTYFRYLEEWGEEFCRKQKHKLYIIKKECKVDEGDEKCSGDGFKCTQIVENENGTITGLDCPGCAKYCGFYKMWIDRKKDEYDKQQKAYTGQKEKCKEESKGAESNDNDKQFCGTLEENAAKFLERLKNGPCKNDSGQDKTGNSHIKFDDQNKDKTFGHRDYCGTCSKFRIKCDNDKCTSGDTNVTCNGKTDISANDIKNEGDSIVLDMRVSDDSKSGFNDDGLEACNGADIFKGFRKEQWKCGEFCGVDICTLEKTNNNAAADEKPILMKELLQRWVYNFLDDYKKIKHKILHCIKNDKIKSTCISGCKENCECVKTWIEKKRTEWEEIKKHYLKQFSGNTSGDYPVKTILEEVIPENHLVNAKNKVIKLSKFGNSCGCSAKPSSTNGKNEDAIECMLKKLEEKATACQSKHSVENQGKCENASIPLPNEEEEIPEENPVEAPKICPTPADDKKKEEEEGGCDQAPPATIPEASPEPAPDVTPPAPAPAAPPSPPAAPTPPKPKPPPQLLDDPLLKTALMSSTIMWSIGIGFAAFTYFYLKKKMKKMKKRKKKYKKKFIEKDFKNNKN